MNLNAAPTHIQESPDNELITHNFATAWRGLQSIHENPDFQAQCKTLDVTDPRYWASAADYAYGVFDDHDEQGERISTDPIAEFLAATPDFVNSRLFLNLARAGEPQPFSEEELDRARTRMAHYNGLIHEIVEMYPGIRFADLKHEAVQAATFGLSNTEALTSATNIISGALRKVQAELGLAALLESRGIGVRWATPRERAASVSFVASIPSTNKRADDTPLQARVVVHHNMKRIQAIHEYTDPEVSDDNPCVVQEDKDGVPRVTMYAMLQPIDHAGFMQPTGRAVKARSAEAAGRFCNALVQSGYLSINS